MKSGFAILLLSIVIAVAQAQTVQESNASRPMPVNPAALIATSSILNPGVVSWVHFGDLNITTADQQNYADFMTIIRSINTYLKNGVNFAFLPGDNVEVNTELAYQLIKKATDDLRVPLYAIPGERDHKKGTALYNKYLEPVNYQSFTADMYHFVFLDVMSGISDAQNSWLTNDLDNAARDGLLSIIFMHSYTQVSELQEVIQRDNVIMVDAGHTQYNDIANDGHTIYSATRSMSKLSEGPAGFSIINIDSGAISWKFKQIGNWPFVMITSPVDKVLMINRSQVLKGIVEVRAKVWDDFGIASATMQIDGGVTVSMDQIGDTQMWSAQIDTKKLADGDHKIKVKVTGAKGHTDSDVITVVVNQSGMFTPMNRPFGPQGNSVGSYTEKGLLGTHTTKSGFPVKKVNEDKRKSKK
jgi:Icc protein